MARLWSKRNPALIVSDCPTVIVSLTNTPAVRNMPPTLDGALETD